MFKLLSTNSKLQKQSGYKIMGLNLAPHSLSGYNVCPHAGLCATICIGEHSGFMKMTNVRNSQVRKTKFFYESRKDFLKTLHGDLKRLENSSSQTAVRLNVDSDIVWEKVDRSLFDYKHTYYDYTKNPRRMYNYIYGKLPPNYHLTFSYSEKSKLCDLENFLGAQSNISVVMPIHYKPDNLLKMPKYLLIGDYYYPVIDGDLHDLRIPEKDGVGFVVGLRAKMKKSLLEYYQNGGFIIGEDKLWT